ncbi:MAG: hypothetical protein ACRDYB_09335 [Acidimicrobiales bacterium]
MAEPDDRFGTEPEARGALEPPEDDSDELDVPHPEDEVDEWGYESFPASDPPQH